ncbi:MAG: alkaline phosphatase family protein [Flavobacterium sp.]|uniref:alkaline phosphatase family protein n=1 Tax=Flavobacterium sp. TaxID=239 RepID=UPI0026050262|nr:alkaline phosphatase family protein [Flavobacterium sp.]MDD5151093.1 alkaline phosphatase family protein [Flavobacterium sp.]
MISIDGTPDFMIDKFLENGVLPPNGAFAKMKKNGAFASTVLPINVASTGPSHISIFTGASPSKTGIVGNRFRNNNQNWNSPNLLAFNQPIASETIFQAAMRQGKKVMTLAGVGIDYTNKNRMTDYMHMYPNICGPSLIIDLQVTDTTINSRDVESFIKLKSTTKSPSKAVFEISGNFKIPLYLYLKDRMFNPMYLPNQLTEIIVDTDDDLKNGYMTTIDTQNWSGMEIEKEGKKFNTSFRILKSDEKTGKFQLFMTAPAEVYGAPNGFLEKLQSVCGLWPGEPENRKQTSGLITEQIWLEQLDKLSKYSKNLILAGMKEKEWDLLFGYFSTLDDVQHRYTLTNPRQIDYKADNGNRPKIYAEIIEKRFQKIDAYLLEIINALPKETNLIIFSDHGMIPIHSTLLLNNYFEAAGFNDSKQNITATSSGNSAHIYINKEKIKTLDFKSYLNRLTDALKSLKDNKTGEPIFELVANQQQQKEYGLYNAEYSGDLFVSCKPGYSISDKFLPEVNFLVQNSFDPKMFENENQATKNFLLNGTMNETGRGVHGCIATLREGQPIFYAIGPDVPKKEIINMYSLQIAPTVAKLLGIQPPMNAELKSGF